YHALAKWDEQCFCTATALSRPCRRWGQTQTFHVGSMSALPPISRHRSARQEGPLSAKTGREQMQQHAVRGRSSYPRRRDVRLLRQSLLRSPSAETTIWFHSVLSFV